MKKIKLFAVAVLLVFCTGAYAQFTNTTSRTSSTVSSDGWNTIWVEYNPIKVKVKDEDDTSLTGFSAGFSHAFSVSQGIPLYLEAGLGLQYANHSEKEYSVKDELTIWSAKIPVNLLYSFDIPNSSISIIPFIGATFRYNLSGTDKISEDNVSVKFNIFDEDDMNKYAYGSDPCNRFQIGWQIGLKARFAQNFMVGVSYGSDFSEFAEDVKIQTTSITFGCTF